MESRDGIFIRVFVSRTSHLPSEKAVGPDQENNCQQDIGDGHLSAAQEDGPEGFEKPQDEGAGESPGKTAHPTANDDDKTFDDNPLPHGGGQALVRCRQRAAEGGKPGPQGEHGRKQKRHPDTDALGHFPVHGRGADNLAPAAELEEQPRAQGPPVDRR